MFVVRTQACLLICKSSWILLRVVLFFFFVVTLQLLPELTTQEKGGMVEEGDA